MKLYDGLGPNPRLIRMFIAEKKLDVPSELVDLVGQKLDASNRNVAAWFERMATRPSAAASAQPGSR